MAVLPSVALMCGVVWFGWSLTQLIAAAAVETLVIALAVGARAVVARGRAGMELGLVAMIFAVSWAGVTLGFYSMIGRPGGLNFGSGSNPNMIATLTSGVFWVTMAGVAVGRLAEFVSSLRGLRDRADSIDNVELASPLVGKLIVLGVMSFGGVELARDGFDMSTVTMLFCMVHVVADVYAYAVACGWRPTLSSGDAD